MSNAQRLPNVNPEPFLHELSPTQHGHALISAETYTAYGSILQEYSANSIDEPDWIIPYMDGLKSFGVHFGTLTVSEDELRLIKAYIVDTLSHFSSPSTCMNRLKHLTYLFAFLHEKHFSVQMLSTHIINLFRLWLDLDASLSAAKKNDIESVLKSFVPFLQGLALIRSGSIIIPKARPLPTPEVVRAPEKALIQKLDKYFFDFTNPIPTAYRCIYLISRLIPTRNNEVLSILIDGFKVEDGLLELWIPTYKETANHEPIYEPYYRLANEYPECILLRALQEQHSFAVSHQAGIVNPSHKGHLMVSNRKPTRLISSDEFNTYLKGICKELNLIDHDGNPANITMYSLRHANGAELSCNPEITADEFTRMFSHTSKSSDNGYGYGSKHDELIQTAQATRAVRDSLSANISSSGSTHTITDTRLAKLQKDNNTHLIGNNSVCQQKGCKPQFEYCVQCASYTPDPQYIPAAETCCKILRQRIEKCKQLGIREFFELNENQLYAYTTFISRAQMQNNPPSQKEVPPHGRTTD